MKSGTDLRSMRPGPGREVGSRTRRRQARAVAPAERVQGVPYADLRLEAPRPMHAVLDALREIGLDTPSSWQDALRAFAADDASTR